MENLRLLEKRRKRLSIYFALFILFSTWLLEGAFLLSFYYANNIKIENQLQLKLKWVENILRNRADYLSKIENNDYAIKSMLEKGLEWVSIFKGNEPILGDLTAHHFLTPDTFYDGLDYKYYFKNIELDTTYKVIVKQLNEYSYYNLFWVLGSFLLFTLPFFLIFYILGYYFVGKNFSPIREMIMSLEDFSANINHELRTPVAEIISTLSLSQELGKNHEKAINTSLYSAKKIAKILDSMLGIINLVDASFQKEKLDMIEEIDMIIVANKEMIWEKKIKIKKVLKNNSYPLQINKEHFHICIGNLLKNAVKYSHEWGTIIIGFNNGVFEIEDRGIGIEEKNLTNIFSRYFRENYLKEEGFWLGLSLVKKITDINGWVIDIESKKDYWTKITLHFYV